MGELSVSRAIEPRTLAEAAAGDTVAFARIVRAHHDDMARVCFVISGDADLAQDAVQAAWSTAWRKLGSLRDPDRLRPWLVTIAANETRQLLRRQRRVRIVEIQVADVGSDADDPAALAEVEDLVTAIRLLPADDRALLALRYVAGFDASEIAKAMGLSASGVRSRLSRLVARLRTELSDE